MTLDEFKAMAEAWGADIGRWPEHLRAAAACLARKPEGVAILVEAEHIDRLIIEGKPEVSSDRVAQAIFDVVSVIATEAHRTTSRRSFLLRRWLIPVASFASAAALGVSIGLVKPLNALRSTTDTTMLTMILDKGSFGPDWMLR
jgi:hypothetical protein